jgi:hypothetical protein
VIDADTQAHLVARGALQAGIRAARSIDTVLATFIAPDVYEALCAEYPEAFERWVAKHPHSLADVETACREIWQEARG